MRILVVDDTQRELKDLEEAVQGAGREVMTATNVEDAVRLIRETDFDVIITDWVMKAGFDVDKNAYVHVLAAVREKGTYTPVIVVTSFGHEKEGAEAIAHGAFDYLARNFVFDWKRVELPTMVERAFKARHERLQEQLT